MTSAGGRSEYSDNFPRNSISSSVIRKVYRKARFSFFSFGGLAIFIDEQSEWKAWGQAFWSDQNMACSPKQGLHIRHTAGPVFFFFLVYGLKENTKGKKDSVH